MITSQQLNAFWNTWNRRKEITGQRFGEYVLDALKLKDSYPALWDHPDAHFVYNELAGILVHDVIPTRTS